MNIAFHISNVLLFGFAVLVHVVGYYLIRDIPRVEFGFWLGVFLVFGVWLAGYILQFRKSSYVWRTSWFLLTVLLMFLSFSLFAPGIASIIFEN